MDRDRITRLLEEANERDALVLSFLKCMVQPGADLELLLDEFAIDRDELLRAFADALTDVLAIKPLPPG